MKSSMKLLAPILYKTRFKHKHEKNRTVSKPTNGGNFKSNTHPKLVCIYKSKRNFLFIIKALLCIRSPVYKILRWFTFC